jgi:hypothetical protein
LEGGDAHTDLGKSVRDALSDFSATGLNGLRLLRSCSWRLAEHGVHWSIETTNLS